MKKTIQFILLVWIVPHIHGAPAKNPSSLQKSTDELFKVSRLVNGIALQHELSSKTLKLDEFVSEVLNVDPGNNALSILRKTELGDVIGEMSKVADEAKAIKSNSSDSASIERKLKTLGDLEANLNLLKKVNKQQFDDFVEKAKLAAKSNVIFFNVKNILSFSKWIGFVLSNYKEEDAKTASSHLTNIIDYFSDFESECSNIKNFATNLNDLWAMEKVNDELEYLEALSQTIVQLKSKYSDLSSLSKDFEELKDEFSVVDKGLTNIAEIGKVAANMNATQKFFETMKSKPLQNRHLTVGFPKGSNDMKLLFKEIKEDWLKRAVAHNDESGWNTLIKELDGFKSLSEKSETVFSSWKSLENITNLKKLSETTDLWTTISETSLNSAEVENLQQSTSRSDECLKKLHPIAQDFNVSIFGKLPEKMKDLSGLATDTRKLFGQLAAIEVLKNDTLIGLLKAEMKQLHNTTVYLDKATILKSMRANQQYKEFLQGLSNAQSILEKTDKGLPTKVLNFNGIDLDLMTSAKEEFEKTQLIPTLECFKEKKFDTGRISDILKFGSDLRALGSHHTQDKTTIPFLKQMIHFKKSYEAVIGNTASKNRSARSASYFSSLDKPLVMSKDLVKGVELVHNLANLHANEKLLSDVANSKKEVLDEMKRVLPSIDIPSFTNGLKKTVGDLKSLESRVQSESDETLQKYVKLFEVASGISGVSINSTLLIDPVSTALSSNKDFKNSSDSFRKLGGLELDYSAHRSELNTASLTLIKLKLYFDGLFHHSKKGSDDSEKEWKIGYSVTGITVACCLVFAGGGYLTYQRWHYRRMQNDPNSFLYLIQAIPEERNRYGFAYWTSRTNRRLPIHDAMYKGEWERFKQLVKNGANVNAYCECSEEYTVEFATPLHLVKRFKEPKYAEYLIKNGAQIDLLDEKYCRASDCIRDHIISVSFPHLEGKKFLRRVPPQLKTKDFKVFEAELNKHGTTHPEFHRKFAGNITKNIKESTHIVLPKTPGNQVELLGNKKYLPYLFTSKMIMSERWLDANSRDSVKKLMVDYEWHRVTNVRNNGTVYHTVAEIYTHIQERRIPYLACIRAYFFGNTPEYWEAIADTVNHLGGISIDHNLLPEPNNRIFMGTSKSHFFHYFKNRGPIFILTEDPEQAKKEKPYLENNNWITWMTREEFIDFVLKFEFTEYPPATGVGRTPPPVGYDTHAEDEEPIWVKN